MKLIGVSGNIAEAKRHQAELFNDLQALYARESPVSGNDIDVNHLFESPDVLTFLNTLNGHAIAGTRSGRKMARA